jgi:hypothetical protein
MKIKERLARSRRASSQRRPITTARMKEEDTQTAAILSLDVQSRFVVGCMIAPSPYEGLIPPSEWIGKIPNLRSPEKHLRGARRCQSRLAKRLIKS